ncbi:branched chain amino acid ABC transporter substrate-binding protein [Winogradskya humida]|uniref:Branched chain amino acid ABC transporter substrate-binding protein n=2 Tax=Winogradskya humida TaxID=113566 RepID=A0ABQ3ZKS7_9ACTN|nr:branched chain amino acid ABC transporter substrate-binding protein [Actinoplanes humidus]
MRLPRRMTAFAAAPALILTALAGCSSDSDVSTRTKIVIGADLALGSAVDNAYADALQLRIEQINASNKLPDHELELRVMDNRSESKQSLSNISTLADDPGIAAIITGECDECVVGAAKTINDKRVPTIALAAADQVATPIESRRYLFKIGPNGSDSAAALTAELDRSGKKKVAIVYANNLYGNGVRSHLVSELQKKPQITVIEPAPVKPTATDVSQVIETVTADKPDALVVLTGSDQATAAVTAAKAAKFKGQVYFDAAAANDLFVPQEAAVATENTTMVFTQILAIDDVIATSPAKAARKQWFRDYTSRYGSYSGVASFGADAVDLIADAVVRAGGDRQRLRDVLETSQTDGLSGPLRLTPDNHSGLMPQALTLLVARSGRWRLLS